jgi:hypothetical protein
MHPLYHMQRILLLFLAATLTCCAPGRSTTSTLNQTALTAHRTVAILPFDVEQNRIQLSDIRFPGADTTLTTQQRVRQEWTAKQQWEGRHVAYRLQELFYDQLQAQKPTRGYTVQFQDVRETNRLLQQAGITYENLPDKSLEEVRQALGVDAVLSGETLLFQPLPNGVGLAARILLNEPLLGNQSIIPASEATTSLTLYDCREKQLAWRLDFQRTGNNALKPERLAQNLVRAAMPSFPYNRK